MQAHDELDPLNSQAPRTLDCIYLRPVTNAQGGHEVFNLATKRVLTRHKVTTVPITTAVIDSVNAMAAADQMQGLVIKSKTGHILYDSAWIAGVDYNEDPNNNDDDDDNNDNSEDNEHNENESIQQ